MNLLMRGSACRTSLSHSRQGVDRPRSAAGLRCVFRMAGLQRTPVGHGVRWSFTGATAVHLVCSWGGSCSGCDYKARRRTSEEEEAHGHSLDQDARAPMIEGG